jgi:hypothetical protein
MGDWLRHFFQTPMGDLAWWEQLLATGFIFGLFGVTAWVFLSLMSSRPKPRHRKNLLP